MAYLVLARKYRPTTFAELVGQEHIVRTLGNAIALDRVHHAFVFTGARGVGKTTTARLLARSLNCEQGPTITPCGACSACREILQGNSPDVLEIDGASNTGVDNVRELRETVRYLPSRSRYKIYIVDEVHMLSQAAFNALLKTLEEPPPHVKFIFATTEPHRIPVTILSRCQRFDFRRVGMANLTEHLRNILQREDVSMGMPALTAVAREAQGSVRDALSLLDQVLSYAGTQPADDQVLEALGVVDRGMLFSLVDALLQRDAHKLLSIIEAVDERGHDLADVASLLLEHLRDLAVARLSESPASALPLRSPDEIEALVKQAQSRSHTDIQRLFALAMRTAEDIGRSPMPKVSLEMGLLRLFDVAPVADLQALIGRLDAIAQGKQPAGGGAHGGGQGGGATTPQTSPASNKPSAATPARPGKRADDVYPDAPPMPAGAHGAPPRTSTHVAPPSAQSYVNAAPSGGASQGGGPNVSGPNARAPGHDGPSTSSYGRGPQGAPAPSQAVASAVPSIPGRMPERANARVLMDAAGPAMEGVHAGWQRFVDTVRSQRPALASVLEHGRLLAFTPNEVRVAYMPGTFYWDAAFDKENRELFTNVLHAQFNQSVPFNVVAQAEGEDGAVSLAELSAERQRTQVTDITNAALDHKAVRDAVAILGGEVKEIRPLQGE